MAFPRRRTPPTPPSSMPSCLILSAPHPYNASETGASTRLPPGSSLAQPHARVGWSPLSTQQLPLPLPGNPSLEKSPDVSLDTVVHLRFVLIQAPAWHPNPLPGTE
ncbi:hypothetical protein KIL84_008834 [Mauremys mutica]|uniref:Uncharacterized protein n=1 Tax=Mauremys mutica TaxID=74926 RepID=A0A9D3X8C9_9SAUR|nr:hypothetical protein KIL84_008834 [Mauremys mutica]